MTSAARLAINWVEQGYVPDAVVRQGIRRLCRQRLEEIAAPDCEARAEGVRNFIAAMDRGPIALVPEQANAQHYEVPADFFGLVLGPQRKYSCCYWPEGVDSLAAAEAAALALTCERAGMADGQAILELGCGWGSLTLWMAEHYPEAHITAVSNSHSQRRYIETMVVERKLRNLKVITADMNAFETTDSYDRVVSVEMFEHLRNWRRMLQRVHGWLRPGGLFFKHVFCHRDTPYLFEDRGADDWMSRHFFSGGMMPSDDLPLYFQDHLTLLDRWCWSGRHYEKTANAWLATMDNRREGVLRVLAATYGREHSALWWQRWRLFFMACAETFAYEDGETWRVGHYLFERPEVAR
jgi:cyclopropane-fatty-acyl-phospholipid synthase